MREPVRLAVAGLGRMGRVHALHVTELARETGACELVALADPETDRALRLSAELTLDVPVFSSVDELASADICDAALIVTPTENHDEHAARMLGAGKRVFLEKPLTGNLASDREFSAELDRHHARDLMLGFQRRFDAPLLYARELLRSGTIGRLFKIYSALEDSSPAPNGYKSGGILPDMSIHNIDEVIWLAGRMPDRALTIGSRLYSHALTTCIEDFDDALLWLWFGTDLAAQIQVSRNHVSGYRVETVLYGEEGQIQVGRFDQRPLDVLIEAYGRRGRKQPLASRTFTMRAYERELPEFVDRFGPAYKTEVAAFVECCQTGEPFPVNHQDGLRAQEVIEAGMNATFDASRAATVGRSLS